MSVDELDESEIQRRYNHYDEQNISRCKYGHFVDKPEPENGQVRYYCSACGKYLLEWTG